MRRCRASSRGGAVWLRCPGANRPGATCALRLDGFADTVPVTSPLLPAARRYIQIVRLLREGMPDTQLLLLALTPRGWGRFVLPSEFSAAFELVNAHLR